MSPKMRFVAVTALRAAGHDVLWIRTDAPGITDRDLLARSLKVTRVDRFFGMQATRVIGASTTKILRIACDERIVASDYVRYY
jgi:hypothetical protein